MRKHVLIQKRKEVTPVMILMASGMIIALLGMQADLRFHILYDFESYLSRQHAIIYTGIMLFMAVAVTSYASAYFDRKPARLGVKLAFIAVIVMIGGGIADALNHEVIIRGFDSLLSWSHVPFVAGVTVASFGAMLELRNSKLAVVGYSTVILSSLALFFVTTTTELPSEFYVWRSASVWTSAFAIGFVIARWKG